MEHLKKYIKGLEIEEVPEELHKRANLVGPIPQWNIHRLVQIGYLKEHGLLPKHYLLDFGCGVLRGGLPIIAYLNKAHYYGLDVSEERLEEGKKELKENNLEHKAPILGTKFPRRKFDCIIAIQVFMHMNDDMVDEAVGKMAKGLKKNGVIYVSTYIGPREDGVWKEFYNITRPLEEYETIFATHGLEIVERDGNFLEIRKGA